jgi:hypothetical protein
MVIILLGAQLEFTALVAAPDSDSDLCVVLRGLEDTDAKAREAAWERAASLGPSAVSAVARVFDAGSPETRIAAGKALERLAHSSARPDAPAGRRGAMAKALAGAASDPERSPALKQLAIELLGSTGGDAAVPALAALLRDADLREPARRALERIPGEPATLAIAGEIPVAGEAFALDLVATLGVRRDSDAFPALAALAADDGKPLGLRAAAARALTRIRVPDALVLVLLVLEAAKPQEPPGLMADLLAMADELRESIPGAAQQVDELVFRHAQGGADRYAALRALSASADSAHLERLLRALNDGSPLVSGLAADLLGKLEGADVDDRLLDLYRGGAGASKAGALRVLAARKAPHVPELLSEAQRSEDIDLKVTALELSGGLGDPALEPVLLAAARGGSPHVRAVALAGLLELAEGRLQTDSARAAMTCEKALDLAADGPTRGRALSLLARTGTPAALARITAAYSDAALQAFAPSAQVLYATAIAARGEKDKAVELLHAVLGSAAPRKDVLAAAEALKALGADPTLFQRSQGFVVTWHVVGPFPNPGGKGFDTAYFPEREVKVDAVGTEAIDGRERRFSWKEVSSSSLEGAVDLEPHFRRTQDVCAYAYAEVASSADRDVELRLGSDDGIVVWLNGEKVHSKQTIRPLQVDQDRAPARLKAGKNRVLVKITQGGGQWSFSFRITDRSGTPLNAAKL